MIQILDENDRALAVLADDGTLQHADDVIKSWWTAGVPGRESDATPDTIGEVAVLVKPDDPDFGLAVGDEVERRGWSIADAVGAEEDEAGTAEKGYHPVQAALAAGDHWITTHGGAHVLIHDRPAKPARGEPAYGDVSESRRNVQRALVSGEWGDSVAHGYESMISALDDFLGDPDGRDATRMRCVAARLWGGQVLKSYTAEPLPASEMREVSGSKDGRLLAKAMKAQYEETQRVLKAAYPSGYITLYRGVRNSKQTILPADEFVDVDSNALESWSSDIEIARRFARKSRTGVVLESHIPIESVWASHHSQPDLWRMNEGEAIVLGDKKQFRSRVVFHTGG